MRTETLAATVALLALAGGFAPPAQSRYDALDAALADELRRSGAPGAVVAIVESDGVAYVRTAGVASVETGVPVTGDTLFQIGSVTKAVTAAAILSAAGEGWLSVESAVGSMVPGLAPCLQRPTLGQLLSHVGGLIDEPAEFGPQGEEGLATYPRTWTTEYCLLAPGRAFSYSNSGFALAGLALQEAEGKAFADVVRARVLGLLGMPRTTFRPTEAMTWPLAVGHQRRDGTVQVVRPLPNDARLWPAGTLYASARELAAFVQALANGGRVGGRPGLPPSVVSAMLTPRASMGAVASEYGYGLELDRFHGERRAGHGGTMTGSVAGVAVLPDRHIGVVALFNGDGARPGPIVDRALAIALGVGTAAPAPPPAVRAPGAAVAAAALDRHVGRFSNPKRFTVDVVLQGDGLVLRRFGRDFPMRPVGPGRFLVDRPGGGEESIVMGFGPDGRAEYLQMNVWALARVGR